MKNILKATFVIFAIFEVIVVCGAATYQPHNLGHISFVHSSGTVTEICTSTPTHVGIPKWCWNCTANGGVGTVCYSTTTAAPGGGCSFILSTGTVCK